MTLALVAGLASISQRASTAPARDAWSQGTWTERTTYAMGTTLRARVRAESREAGIAAIESAFGRIEKVEGRLSTWRSGTEMAHLNGAPVGVPFRVSGELLSLLMEARDVWEETDGAFDPAVGPLIEAWELRGAGRRPTQSELAAAVEATGLRRFEIDASRGTIVRTHERAWLDTGGFGKGAALREARAALVDAGIRDAILDFGGQIVAIGSEAEATDSRGWRIAVAHPARREEPAVELLLEDASAATTAASARFVTVEGKRWGHIVDPRTGLPVPAWGSVTVVDHDPVRADALSTGLFVLGAEACRAWLQAHPDVTALVLEETEDGLSVFSSESLRAKLVAASTEDEEEES